MGSFRPVAGFRHLHRYYNFTESVEFRYLRTVIVTAAVYWGLNSMLRCLTSPLNLPAPGRRQPLYFTLRFRRDLCFW